MMDLKFPPSLLGLGECANTEACYHDELGPGRLSSGKMLKQHVSKPSRLDLRILIQRRRTRTNIRSELLFRNWNRPMIDQSSTSLLNWLTYQRDKQFGIH